MNLKINLNLTGNAAITLCRQCLLYDKFEQNIFIRRAGSNLDFLIKGWFAG